MRLSDQCPQLTALNRELMRGYQPDTTTLRVWPAIQLHGNRQQNQPNRGEPTASMVKSLQLLYINWLQPNTVSIAQEPVALHT